MNSKVEKEERERRAASDIRKEYRIEDIILVCVLIECWTTGGMKVMLTGKPMYSDLVTG